jgi:hypothetical protein
METSKNHVPELCIQPFSHKEMRYSLLATMYCIYDFSKDKQCKVQLCLSRKLSISAIPNASYENIYHHESNDIDLLL